MKRKSLLHSSHDTSGVPAFLESWNPPKFILLALLSISLLVACGQKKTDVSSSKMPPPIEEGSFSATETKAYEPQGSTQKNSQPQNQQIVEVKIKNLKFVPSTLKVKVGTTVRWVNEDPFSHDVTSGKAYTGRQTRGMKKTKFPDGKFQSGLFGKGKVFSYTFEKKGVYDYYCNAHPFMTGQIVVEE